MYRFCNYKITLILLKTPNFSTYNSVFLNKNVANSKFDLNLNVLFNFQKYLYFFVYKITITNKNYNTTQKLSKLSKPSKPSKPSKTLKTIKNSLDQNIHANISETREVLCKPRSDSESATSIT